MTTLKMAFHEQTKRRIVEVFGDDGAFIAAIYPSEDGSNSIHVVSKHFAPEPFKASVSMIPIPGWRILFAKKSGAS